MKTETVNLLKANYIYSLTEEELKDLVYDDKELNENGDTTNWKSYYTYIRTYLKRILIEGNPTYNVEYTVKTNNRQYSNSGSIQMLQNDIRGFLVDTMTDYDMKNCHPTITKYLCDKHNIPCPLLTDYCNNREECWIRMNPYINSKDELKSRGKVGVLVKMNTDKVGGVRWLGDFSKEMFNIKNTLLDLEAPQQSTPGSKNPISSKFNKLLCSYENELLVQATDNLKICSLMFDGFLTSDPVSLEELDQLGSKYGITWTIKEPSKKIKLPEGYQAKELDGDYLQYREIFEERNIVLNSPHGVHRLGNNGWDLRTIKDILSIYSNTPYFHNPSTDKLEQFINIWLKDPDRRTCESMEFVPYSKNPPKISNNTFNTFIPFQMGGSIDTDFVSEFLLPLTLELCECNDLLQTYLLNWIAHLIQYPEQLPEVMIVLKGREGNGKDTLGKIITKMIGKKYTHYTDKQGEVLGKFNSSAKEKLLITLNEGTDLDAMMYVEPMKHFFCAREISIKGECDKPYMTNNYARGIMNSNNVRPVQVTDTNRRFFVTRTTDKYMGDKAWFARLYEELEQDGVVQTLFNWFYNRDISEFKVRDFPKGSLEQLLKESTVKPVTRFIHEAMIKPIDGWGYNPKNHNELWVNKAKFGNDFKSFCLKENYKCTMTAQKIKLELSDLSQSITEGQRTINEKKGRTYIFDQQGVLKDVLKNNSALTDEVHPDEHLEADVIYVCDVE